VTAAADRPRELSSELERLAEQLADLAMDLLREGLADGTDEGAALATQQSKVVNRARSAVEKAALLLRRLPS
jgi:hypothetical protein